MLRIHFVFARVLADVVRASAISRTYASLRASTESARGFHKGVLSVRALKAMTAAVARKKRSVDL